MKDVDLSFVDRSLLIHLLNNLVQSVLVRPESPSGVGTAFAWTKEQTRRKVIHTRKLLFRLSFNSRTQRNLQDINYLPPLATFSLVHHYPENTTMHPRNSLKSSRAIQRQCKCNNRNATLDKALKYLCHHMSRFICPRSTFKA